AQAAEDARTTARAHYEYARTRLQGGIGTRIDEIRAAQEVASDEAQLESALGSLARAQEALGVLVAGEGPADAEMEIALPDAPPLPAALDGAERARSDVRALEARLEAARKLYRDRWVYFLPTLTAVLQPFYQNPPSLVQPLTGW